MKRFWLRFGIYLLAVVGAGQIRAQTSSGTSAPPVAAPSASPGESAAAGEANPWDFNLSVSGYIVPDGQSYASPVLTADHDTLHLEARYNYEGQRTGSLWLGHNFSVGKKVTLDATPMIGGVFGNLNGIAPGLEVTVTYKKLEFYSANEYIFDTDTKDGNFFYTWTQLTYSPVKWFTAGYVVQRTRAYDTPLDIQRGPLIGFNFRKFTFTTQVFNMGEADPTTVFSLGYSF